MSALRLGVAHSRFNAEIGEMLLEGAREEIARAGAEVEYVAVAGALELPVALQWMAGS